MIKKILTGVAIAMLVVGIGLDVYKRQEVWLHHTNLGTVTKTINNGVQLDPNKTYHMVVFYMERGEAESNFLVNFTMTRCV